MTIEQLENQIAQLTERLATFEDNPQLLAVTEAQIAQAKNKLHVAKQRIPARSVRPPAPGRVTPLSVGAVVAAGGYPPCHKCGSILEDVVTRCTQGGDCAESDLIAPIERPEPVVERHTTIEREEIKEPASNEG